jgi:hypothetical protein
MSRDSGDGWGAGHPSRESAPLPRARPRWLAVLSLLMLLGGARLFLASLSDMRKLATGQQASATMAEGLRDVQKELILRGQWAVETTVDRAHPTAAWVHAVTRFALAAIMLFAVAAVFSDDSRGRIAALLAGWGTMLLGASNAVFLVLVVRHGLPTGLAALEGVAAEVHARAGSAPPPAADLAELTRMLMLHVPMATSLVGLGFGLVLVVAFGGRRGRLFYNRGEQADHG